MNTSHSNDSNGWVGFHFTANGTHQVLIGADLRSSVDCAATVVSLPDLYMATVQDLVQYTVQWYAYDNGTAATWKLVRDIDGAALFDAQGGWAERQYTAGYGCDNTVSDYWTGSWFTGAAFPCHGAPGAARPKPPLTCATKLGEIPEGSFTNTSRSYDGNGWVGFHFTANGTHQLLIGGDLRSSADCTDTVVSLPDYYMAQAQDGLQYTIQWYAYDNGTAATWKLVRDSDGAVLFDALTNGNWVERKYTAGYGCDNTVSAYWSGTWFTGTAFPCQLTPPSAPRQ